MKSRIAYLTGIVLVVSVAVLTMTTFKNKSYAAVNNDVVGDIADGTSFKFSFKNTYSHYHIKNNFRRSASGTKVLVNANNKNQKVLVYCAEQGVTLGSSYTRKRYGLNSSSVPIKDNVKNKLSIMMNYAYPYITLGELKTMLKGSNGLGSEYEEYEFDKLNVQETITAVQAAIWNIMKNTNKFEYDREIGSSDDSSLKKFAKCTDYYEGKILTSEEEEWYKKSGCDKNGDFYKNVFQKNSSGVKNRVNALINWYTNTLLSKVTSVDTDKYSIKNKTFNVEENGTLTLNVEISTNASSYSIIFKDLTGKTLLETDNRNGNNFVISNLPADIKEVSAVITSNSPKKNVYYYKGSGQDFIGVDNSKYTTTLSISNDGTGKIIIYKVKDSSNNVEVRYDLDNVDKSLCGSGCMSGADFILYASNKTYIKNVFVTSNEPTVIDNLPIGVYYLKEEQPPLGYDYYDYNTNNVDKDGYIKISISDSKTEVLPVGSSGSIASVIVNNEPTKIIIKKVDKNDHSKILDDAEFFIEDIDESLYEDFVTSSQQKDGYVVEGLPIGSYYLEEVKNPLNYFATHTKYKFTVGKYTSAEDMDADAIEVKAVNNVITIENIPGIVISKTDFTTGGCVAGAKLVVRDKDNKVVNEWISSCENGKDTQQISLDPGTYTLTEDLTPKGYATAETITFTVDANGKVDKSLEMKDAPINVCINKVTKGTNEPLEGAEFEIYDANGKLYDRFKTTKQEYCLQYMPIGKYTIKEVKAPNGYQIITELKVIEVKDTSQKQIFTIENEIEVPKTDLNASKVIALIATVFAIFGLGLVSYYGYRKQN